MKFAIYDLRFTRVSKFGALILIAGLSGPLAARSELLLLNGATVHTVSGGTIADGKVLIEDGKVLAVANTLETKEQVPTVDLKGLHLYPGMIALNTDLGLVEIEAVRATRDDRESGEGYTPEVLSWLAVNPDSEMLPVARANGVSHFEPVPAGNTVAGQSGLVVVSGWTSEQMAIKKPIALHVFWPSANLQTNPRERGRTRERPKPIEEQAKEHREKIKALTEFFEEARAYVKARDAVKNGAPDAGKIPAWESMIAVVRGEIPIVVHADDVREIRAAVTWADTNHFKLIIADGRDAAKAAALLGEKKVPVIFDHVFTQPPSDSQNYDVEFTTPEVLRKAGVKVIFSPGLGNQSLVKNLPYHAAQAVAFGLPPDEALKGITLYPAQIAGVADKLGSIEVGKEATLFVSDGDILDIRSNVKRMWIAGKEVSLESRHTRLYEKYKSRPVSKKE